jgi:hypothetical protein
MAEIYGDVDYIQFGWRRTQTKNISRQHADPNGGLLASTRVTGSGTYLALIPVYNRQKCTQQFITMFQPILP